MHVRTRVHACALIIMSTQHSRLQRVVERVHRDLERQARRHHALLLSASDEAAEADRDAQQERGFAERTERVTALGAALERANAITDESSATQTRAAFITLRRRARAVHRDAARTTDELRLYAREHRYLQNAVDALRADLLQRLYEMTRARDPALSEHLFIYGNDIPPPYARSGDAPSITCVANTLLPQSATASSTMPAPASAKRRKTRAAATAQKK